MPRKMGFLAEVGATQEPLPGMAQVLPEKVEGVSLYVVEEFVKRFLVLDAEATEITGRKNDLCEEFKERGMPLKTVKAAMAIVKAQQRAQAPEILLTACVNAVRRLVQ